MIRPLKLSPSARKALRISLWICAALAGVAPVAMLGVWVSSHPWFKPILAIGFAVFLCGLLFLLFRLLYQALRGWGLLK